MYLLLTRHAKSSRPGGVADHDRPLSRRGVADAVAIGDHLFRLGLLPARIVSSTAVRAAETARLIAASAAPPPRVEREPILYGAGVAEVLDVVRARPTASVMVVGHEPTLSMTVEALCGAVVTMATGAVVCIDLHEGQPSGLESGTLQWMLTPRLARGHDS